MPRGFEAGFQPKNRAASNRTEIYEQLKATVPGVPHLHEGTTGHGFINAVKPDPAEQVACVRETGRMAHGTR